MIKKKENYSSQWMSKCAVKFPLQRITDDIFYTPGFQMYDCKLVDLFPIVLSTYHLVKHKGDNLKNTTYFVFTFSKAIAKMM